MTRTNKFENTELGKILDDISKTYAQQSFNDITKAVCSSTEMNPVMDYLVQKMGKTPRMFYLAEIKELPPRQTTKIVHKPVTPSAATGGAPQSPFLYSGPRKPIL